MQPRASLWSCSYNPLAKVTLTVGKGYRVCPYCCTQQPHLSSRPCGVPQSPSASSSLISVLVRPDSAGAQPVIKGGWYTYKELFSVTFFLSVTTKDGAQWYASFQSPTGRGLTFPREVGTPSPTRLSGQALKDHWSTWAYLPWWIQS